MFQLFEPPCRCHGLAPKSLALAPALPSTLVASQLATSTEAKTSLASLAEKQAAHSFSFTLNRLRTGVV